MKNIILLTILVFLKGFCCLGQVFQTSYPSDTLYFEKLKNPTIVANLDSSKDEIIYTIDSPAAYIFKSKNKLHFDYSIAIKNKDNYSIYQIFTGDSTCQPERLNTNADSLYKNLFGAFGGIKGYIKSSEIIKIDKCKFDSEKNDEIIIQFSSFERYSNSQGWSRTLNGYQIWDLDKLQVITLTNYERYENWPYGDEMYATNSGMVRFFEYQISFEQGFINISIDGTKTQKYIYANDKFVRRK
jgi:hypothetical protein